MADTESIVIISENQYKSIYKALNAAAKTQEEWAAIQQSKTKLVFHSCTLVIK